MTIFQGLGPSVKMAAYLQWRRFAFFDRETVKEPAGADGTGGKALVLPSGIAVCDSGRGNLVFGDILICTLAGEAGRQTRRALVTFLSGHNWEELEGGSWE